MYGFVAALALIVGAVVGLSLGVWFSVGMVALTGAAILYQTQTIIQEFPVAAHVAGALALFSSVMTLFWYILQLVGVARDWPRASCEPGALLAITCPVLLLAFGLYFPATSGATWSWRCWVSTSV